MLFIDSLIAIIQELALYKLYAYLKSTDNLVLLQKYSALFEDNVLKYDEQNYREAMRLAVDCDADFNLPRNKAFLDLLLEDPIGATMLELCVIEASLPELAKLLSEIVGFYGISLEFAYRVSSCIADADFSDYCAAYKQFDKLTAFLLGKPDEKIFFCRSFTADERLFAFINQSDDADKRLDGICELCGCESVGEVYVGGEYLPPINSQLADFDSPVALLQITGADGVGKRFLLKNACFNIKRGIVLADWNEIAAHEPAEIRDIIRRIIREALFYKYAICLYDITEKNTGKEQDVEKLVALALQPIKKHGIKTILLTDETVSIYPYIKEHIGKINVKNHTRNQRITLWECFCKEYGLKAKIDYTAYASNFVLTPREIEKTVEDLVYQEQSGILITDEVVASACYNVIKTLKQGSIKKISTPYKLDDLKLPPEQKQALQSLCNHVVYRHKVYDLWGMESKYPYGRGVSALFTGPPGTGKTMAAHILSDMIHMHLYRIDLSQVVDKYIGETEKRLEEIFNTAEKSNVILFFDEADAIFGKRSEVNDAKDKYANTETSYILQRIEEYEGIVILATNYKKNIDEAFMRRIRYLVEFPLPSAATREEIWRGAFSNKIPLQDIDFAYLARQFELSGGSIKNIVLNASFLAAGDNSAVAMQHILLCVKRESLKMGRTMLAQDFGEYSDLQF
ncbi:MAG: ATP-binding protein [Oscillospiraceae bacterium]